MKNIKAYTGKCTIQIAVPETVEEFDSLAKKPGAAIDAAVTNEIYHGTLGDIRSEAEKLINDAYKSTRRNVGTGVFEDGIEAIEKVGRGVIGYRHRRLLVGMLPIIMSRPARRRPGSTFGLGAYSRGHQYSRISPLGPRRLWASRVPRAARRSPPA